MLARNHVFTLRAMENDRSPVALVATCGRIYQQEFTNNNNLSYHVSLMISKTLTAFKTSAKQLICASLINTFKMSPSWEKKISSS